MIDFTNVEKRRLSYELYFRWISFATRFLYFRKLEIKGLDNLPKEPYILISNHQDGLIDALIPIFGIPRHRIVFIARGDIFKKDFVAKLLKWLRVLPAFRVRDTGKENLGENDKIFDLAAQILKDGNIIGLFPEAALQYDKSIGTFKKGFARIAFRAEEFSNYNLHLKIVPTANYYENFYSAGHDALYSIGEPFEFDEFFDMYREHPEAAYRQLSLKAQEHVRPLMLDIADKENFEQIDLLREVNWDVKGVAKKRMSERLACDQKMIEAVKKLKEESQDKFGMLMEGTRKYSEQLVKLNFKNWLVGSNIGFVGMFLRTLLSVILAPIYVVLWLLCIVPYKFPDILAKKAKDKRMIASFRFAIGSVLAIPIWNLILFGLSFIIPWPWWCSFILLAVLTVLFVPFMALRHWFVKFYHRWRYFAKLGKDVDLKQAVELKAEIAEELSGM